MANMETDSFLILTEYGYSFFGTNTTIVTSLSENNLIQIPISECKVGNYLFLKRANPFSSTLIFFDNSPFKDPVFKYPKYLTSELASVLGVLYSKRLFQDMVDPKVKEIYFTFKDMVKFEAFNSSYMNCFEWPPLTSKDKISKLFYSKLLPYVQKWLTYIGFTLTNRCIPECILNAPKEYVLDFILAFTGFENLSRKRKIVFNATLHSHLFIQQFRSLLLNLGYITNLVTEYECMLLSKNIDKQIPLGIKSIIPENYFPVKVEQIIQTEIQDNYMNTLFVQAEI